MLNADDITLFPVSARGALELKVSGSFRGLEEQEKSHDAPHQTINNFSDLEKYLYSFLDETTSNGIERIRLKLETPVRIAEQLVSASQRIAREEFQQAEQDLLSVNDLVSSVQEHAWKMENESITRKRQILSLVWHVPLTYKSFSLLYLNDHITYSHKCRLITHKHVPSSLRNLLCSYLILTL